MADGLSVMVNEVTASLSKEENRTLQYLCTDVFANSCVEDLRGALLDFARQSPDQPCDALLKELMFRLKRFDILKKVLGTNKQQMEGSLQKGGVLSDYRVLMADVSDNLEKQDLQSIIFLLNNTLPRDRATKATSFLDVVVELEKLDEVSCDKLDLLEQCLRSVRRMDLVKKVQAFQNRGQNVTCSAPEVPKQNHVQVRCQGPLNPVRHSCNSIQLPKNLKLSVPETGTQIKQAGVEEYPLNPDQKGVCVLIDRLGFDGETLKQTFIRLGFIFYSFPGLNETQKFLEDLAHRRHLQKISSFICCLISRGTERNLLDSDSHGPGVRLEDLKELFSPVRYPSLGGKPKLFFTQMYRATGAQQRPPMYDEFLETDGPSCHCTESSETLPVSADVLWSLSIAEARLLESSDHRSVYLQALHSALLRGFERKTHILDVMTEVNSAVFSHNQQNPGKKYQLQLSHTLRKKLYI